MLDTDSSAIALMELDAEYSLSTGYTDYYNNPMPLQLDAYHKASIQGNAKLLVVPAESKEAEVAMRFIEVYVKYLDGGTRAMLCPHSAVPVEDSAYAKNLQELVERVELNKKLAEKAEGAEQRFYEEMTSYFQERLNAMIARGRYSITQEDLERNRKIMDLVYFDTSLSFAVRDALFCESNLLDQLLDGAVTVEQFVNEVNQKARMVYLEMQ